MAQFSMIKTLCGWRWVSFCQVHAKKYDMCIVCRSGYWISPRDRKRMHDFHKKHYWNGIEWSKRPDDSL